MLPREFLTQTSRKYQLSQEQEEAFLELFSGNKNELSVAAHLYVSHSALRTRMSWVYKKFGINGKGRGKLDKLKQFLVEEYQKQAPPLVQEVREKVKFRILNQCGTMRVLDMNQPIELGKIYTNANILEKITGRRRLEIDDLKDNLNLKSEDFDRLALGRIAEERVSGLKVVQDYPKLMVLGKPGAGKTTFLKYIAIQCIRGQFQVNLVPIFINLKDFAETPNQPNVLKFIKELFVNCGVKEAETAELIEQGKSLILLDGLDEVREKDSRRVIKQIRDFSDRHHTNRFIITCRIAAQEYTFEKFTEVEIADFNDEQIHTFAQNWFQLKDPVKAERFIEKLKNKDNEPIKELATNPLLLTLLCLVFEETANFPQNRSELYQEGIEVLLKKWDAKRNIERDQVYKNLSLLRKEDLLCHIALTTFKQGDYFFKQKDVERYIADYICNLLDAKTDPLELQQYSEAVLKSLEAQHGLMVERAKGIYSFSHLTFQEYFTARKIVTISEPQALDKALQSLVIQITEKRWSEVFLLAVEMLPSADYLLELMKKQVDMLVASDKKLQKFLIWVRDKSRSVNVPYKQSAIRAFYFARTHALARAIDSQLAFALTHPDLLDFELNLDRDLTSILARAQTPEQDIDRNLIFSRALALDLKPELKQKLKQLKEQLPSIDGDRETFKQFWEEHGKTWTEQLRKVMIDHCNLGYNWDFSEEQRAVLKQYHNANKLLVACLNSDCYVCREVREKIEDTLLLPFTEKESPRLE